ncbi:MAG TPA: NAD(P)-dependent oxidoreductase [Actinotalea caeni]|uniref:NAD(P)-dependent oxidoreductase n=1 Tax=Actinotalea caeni TaxID=1348467 RepID=UPI0012E32384|nr:NAD(P)-dependent oxidoreductase [Actinotalea caeni]HLV56168.1 NAD(P)-dependent oxidoreductase [Actinotalea caeni]
MTAIGFIGPGIMGAPMVRNLVTAGHEVRVYGASERARARAAETGGQVVDSVADAARGCEVLITMLPDGPVVHEVLLGEDGAISHLDPGALLVDHSTISPAEALAVHEAAAAAGVRCLDAPVSGGEAGAVEGVLSIMVGGDREAFEAAKPLFEVVGSTIELVGPAGSGQVVKAANQLMVAGHIQMLAEALVFLGAHGVEPETALDVLGGGLAGSTVLTRKRAAMVNREFAPGFRIALHDKDLGIVDGASKEQGLALPLTAAVTALMRSARRRGYGDLDHSALLQLLLDLNGEHAGVAER